MTTFDILRNVLGKNTLTENLERIRTEEIDSLDYINRQMKFEEVPVEPKEGAWQRFDYGEYTSIDKSFTMINHDHLIYFVNEILRESQRINHHPRLTIDHMSVDISLYTKDFNDVTESDIKLSRIIDEVYNDIFFIE